MEVNSSLPSLHNASDRIDRRSFIQKASAVAMAFSFPVSTGFFKDARMGVVVHSYGTRWNSKVDSKKYPGFNNAIDLLEHCHRIGAGGIQVVVRDWSMEFAKKVRERREKLGLYLEGSIGTPKKSEDVSKFEQEVISAKEAGATVLRTVCTSGRRYEAYLTAEAFRQAMKDAVLSLRLAEPIVRKHKMKLAVENHKDWRANELVGIMKEISSEWIGVTLDFGNSIALLENPMEVIQTLAPYLFTTHVKDMGVDEYADGFLLSEVPLGEGILNLGKIYALCKQHNPNTTFNLEMITRDPLEIPCLTENYWTTFGGVAATELAQTLRMVRQNKFKSGLPRVSHLTPEARLEAEEKNILSSFAYSRASLEQD